MIRRVLPACGLVAVMSVVLVVNGVYANTIVEPYVAVTSGLRAFTEPADAGRTETAQEIALAMIGTSVDEEQQAGAVAGTERNNAALTIRASGVDPEAGVLGVNRVNDVNAAAGENDADGILVARADIAKDIVVAAFGDTQNPEDASDDDAGQAPSANAGNADAGDGGSGSTGDNGNGGGSGDGGNGGEERAADPDPTTDPVNPDPVEIPLEIKLSEVRDMGDFVYIIYDVQGKFEEVAAAGVFVNGTMLNVLPGMDANGVLYFRVDKTLIAGAEEFTLAVIVNKKDEEGNVTQEYREDAFAIPEAVRVPATPDPAQGGTQATQDPVTTPEIKFAIAASDITSANCFIEYKIEGEVKDATKLRMTIWGKHYYATYDPATGIARFEWTKENLFNQTPVVMHFEVEVVDSAGNTQTVTYDRTHRVSGGTEMPEEFRALLDDDMNYIGPVDPEPGDPADPADPAATNDPADPADPATTDPADPADPAATTDPTDPADPAATTDPADPAGATDPADPAGATNPADPAGAADPAAPAPAANNPATPADPAAPAGSTDPEPAGNTDPDPSEPSGNTDPEP
ncbi:MAG: hypothetical protein IJR58_04525 [Lachnospiraceae bacterium]|nr:hypothetical protein [Lachnospiraceae bacterium]